MKLSIKKFQGAYKLSNIFLNSRRFSTNFKMDPKFVEDFREKGFAHIKGVFSSDQIEEIKAEVQDIIKKSDISELKSKFDTNHKNDDSYFIESGDKIRFFLEQNAFNEEGKLIHPIRESINKIGHGKYIFIKNLYFIIVNNIFSYA